MLETIVQSCEHLSNYLKAFRGVFKNRPQYQHFHACGLGLVIYLGSRNLAGLHRAITSGKSACSLCRFIAAEDVAFLARSGPPLTCWTQPPR